MLLQVYSAHQMYRWNVTVTGHKVVLKSGCYNAMSVTLVEYSCNEV